MTGLLKCASFFIISITALFIYSCTPESEQIEEYSANQEISEGEKIPLIYHMSFISRYTKKLYFAGDAENWELADIYSHEIEEISEDIVNRNEEHGGINISELMESMLLPQIEQVEEAIDNEDHELFLEQFNVLIQTCNQCHTASNYDAVRVTIPEMNPFNQDFNRVSE